MSWKEYILKCYAYRRMNKEKWEHTRFLAYRTTIAPYLNPKMIPRSIDKFLPLGSTKRSEVSDDAKASFREHFIKYLQQKENKS